jgi:CubicO group peptidase (beta-lactamase class C family)
MQMLKHKVMKQVILISSILFLLPFTLLSQDISKKTISEIEELAKKYAELNDIPTINVGIVIGKNTYFINNGVKNRKTGIETSENSIFQIASVGKLLTGIVINDLIIKGKLNKNEPITSYLPETYSKRVNNKLKNITVRDLLHHQSGLPRQSKVINRKNDEPIIYNYTQTDFEKDFEKMKIKSSGTFTENNEKDKLFLTSDTRDAWNGTGISYGYGMFDWGNGGFGHGGGMDGYGSEYWLNPKENVAFVLLTSSGGKWVTELS